MWFCYNWGERQPKTSLFADTTAGREFGLAVAGNGKPRLFRLKRWFLKKLRFYAELFLLDLNNLFGLHRLGIQHVERRTWIDLIADEASDRVGKSDEYIALIVRPSHLP